MQLILIILLPTPLFYQELTEISMFSSLFKILKEGYRIRLFLLANILKNTIMYSSPKQHNNKMFCAGNVVSSSIFMSGREGEEHLS